ncbi:hypothetical protein MKX03_029709 [Papaver bracteatum]|nr:hypothetical protein MKX03_029709 [Papaver bracteatum]
MEKYVVHCPPSPDNPQSSFLCRPPWERSVAELVGRYSPKYRHDVSTLLLESYPEHFGGLACRTHRNSVINIANRNTSQVTLRRDGISALEFDSKGVYVASVTKSGCLTVHDFETLYCLSNGSSPYLKEDDTKHLLHLSMNQQLDVVRWNIANQDEVACTSVQSNEILIFDIGYVSSEPVEVLRQRPTVNVHGSEVPRGLSDIAFTLSDKSSNLPCLELSSTDSRSNLNSIQLNVENQISCIVFGAGKHGIVYAWDLHGGRISWAFRSHREVKGTGISCILSLHPVALHDPFFFSMHLIPDLQFQIYAVGSSSSDGIHLLDFYPRPDSACMENKEIVRVNAYAFATSPSIYTFGDLVVHCKVCTM